MSSSSGTATSSSQSARPEQASAGWDVEALRAIWARQQGQVNTRIGVLENALAACANGRLEADLRCEAERAAHTLAGSLGMFGFVSASDAARKLERELANPKPQRSPELSELLEQLRAGMKSPVVLCSDMGDSLPDGLQATLPAGRAGPFHVRPAQPPETGR
jgi:HPt (histidine-containing phosphotransfer) domain-containing protein